MFGCQMSFHPFQTFPPPPTCWSGLLPAPKTLSAVRSSLATDQVDQLRAASAVVDPARLSVLGHLDTERLEDDLGLGQVGPQEAGCQWEKVKTSA